MMLTGLVVSIFSDADEIADKVKKDFLILKSTKSYDEAKRFAEASARQMDIPYKTYGEIPHETNGLTLSPAMCESLAYSYPCYLPRGIEDGVFVSLEYSDHFEGFQKGYYIVMAASGKEVYRILNDVKKVSPDAYIKSSAIFVADDH